MNSIQPKTYNDNDLFQVYNIIPSISAITGVSPQRYFWRFSIALHIGPRLPIAFVYKNYYRSLINEMKRRRAPIDIITKANLLISLILVLNIIEVASLGGVTYISNRENYRKLYWSKYQNIHFVLELNVLDINPNTFLVMVGTLTQDFLYLRSKIPAPDIHFNKNGLY